MFYNKQEVFNTFSHLTGFLLGLAGMILLILATYNNLPLLLISLIYSICMLMMFGASALYHSQKDENYVGKLSRKIDHSAIYLMIAGSYTIISYLFLPKLYYIPLIIVEWVVACLGIYFKSKQIKKKSFWDTSVYIIMGWLAILALPYLVKNLSLAKLMLLFFGGVAYTIGAIMSYYKKPILIRGVIEGHEMFHILIILGAVLHYLLIFAGISE